MSKRIAIVTLFPEMFTALSEYGISGRALKQGLLALKTVNPRQFTLDRHQTVDDRPYGGGPGMVMKAEPLKAAVDEARRWLTSDTKHCASDSADSGKGKPRAKVIYLSPQGRVLKQEAVKQFALNSDYEHMVLIAGRYEGIDERFIADEVDEEWSIGDYVLSGGELPAMVMLDALIRLLPNALGHEDSAEEDSFSDGLLDYPHYTRPENYADKRVPSVLLSGNHDDIRRWRLQQSLGRTWLRRPELLREKELNSEEQGLLDDFQASIKRSAQIHDN